MSSSRFPWKLIAAAFGSLALLAFLPIAANTRTLLLMGWVVVIYFSLAQWTSSEERRAFREAMRSRMVLQSVPEEFFDADRIALQQDSHTWEGETSLPGSHEIISHG